MRTSIATCGRPSNTLEHGREKSGIDARMVRYIQSGSPSLPLKEMTGVTTHYVGSHIDITEKVMAALNQNFQLGTHEYRCTPSIGATLFNGQQAAIEELMKQADISMYKACLLYTSPSPRDGLLSR